ncbi:TPA: hypothetical protein PXA14_001536 [Mannheimia haemolytica]|nr:hypothetical protein [Mannheimia haemolytica]
MTTQITTAQINDLLKSHDIQGYANEWQGRRIYINLSAKNNESKGDRNYQLYIDLATGELVSKLGKGLTTRAFDAAVKAFENAFNAKDTAENTAPVESKETEQENKQETTKLVITKPTLKGSEKQIAWADEIINLFIAKIGDTSIPVTATQEQITQAQAMVDNFFAMTNAGKWIEKFKGLNDSSEPKQFWLSVKYGW